MSTNAHWMLMLLCAHGSPPVEASEVEVAASGAGNPESGTVLAASGAGNPESGMVLAASGAGNPESGMVLAASGAGNPESGTVLAASVRGIISLTLPPTSIRPSQPLSSTASATPRRDSFVIARGHIASRRPHAHCAQLAE